MHAPTTIDRPIRPVAVTALRTALAVIGAVLAVGFVYMLREFASPHAQGVFQLAFGGSTMLPRARRARGPEWSCRCGRATKRSGRSPP